MAPVKPIGVNEGPKTKPGVTGFVQEYNQEPTPQADLNPDAVTDPDSLPTPRATPNVKVPRASKRSKR